MCGITGIFAREGRAPAERLQAMNAALLHRGPDDAGCFSDERVGLAMRRLSIIGVSNGRQPLFNENRSVVLILNGEIYNHVALRADLRQRGHRFNTNSDAEVAVHLYEEFGDSFLEHLRGMFALGLYDRRRGRLLLARDRAGKKPLYYAVHAGCLLFASEIKALHASGLVPKRLDVAGIPSYLDFGFVPGEGTLFEKVRKVPAGFMLKVSSRRLEVQRYWDVPLEDPSPPTIDEAADRVRALLEEAVEIRLMSEVPLGAFLSGGADSTAVVAVMARKLGREPLDTFCVGFRDRRLDELAHARRVARHVGTRHHEVVVNGCAPELLREINWYQDEPAGDPASVPTFCLARFARRYVTVAVTGEGGDEIFAGYDHHRWSQRIESLEARLPGLRATAHGLAQLPFLERQLPARLRKGMWITSLPPGERGRAWISAFTDGELERLLAAPLRERFDSGALAQPFRPLQRIVRDRDSLTQLLYLDEKLSLADHLLMKVDKMTMAASLEARCPLLDQELVAYASRLPSEFKLHHGVSKRVLRKALRDLVPDEILNRPKHGFEVPLDTWLLRDLRPLVEGLQEPDAPLRAYLEPKALCELWSRFERTREARLAQQLWRIVNLAIWHELHWPTGELRNMGAAASDVGT